MIRRAITTALLLGGCTAHTTTLAPPTRAAPVVPRAAPSAISVTATTSTSTVSYDQVSRGELPWWHDLRAGVFVRGRERVVLAVGRSSDHHHVAEGFLRAKVLARLGARKAAEPISFSGTMPEPELSDLFITRAQKFYALYQMPLPKDATLDRAPPPLELPTVLLTPGRRRVGRHIYSGARHLYLECEVEGPVANPDWGRNRATAMKTP